MGSCYSTGSAEAEDLESGANKALPETSLDRFTQAPKIRVHDRWPQDAFLYEPWLPHEAPADMKELLRGKPVQMGPLFAGKRTLLLGMPGAFTPNCTRVHLPQYVSHANDFYSAGVDQIIVMVANDACVVAAWADAAGCASAGIRVLSDRECAVAKRTGLALDARPEVGRITVHRFGALIDDGVVKVIMTEPGGLGLSVSLAVPVLFEAQSLPRRRLTEPLAEGASASCNLAPPTAQCDPADPHPSSQHSKVKPRVLVRVIASQADSRQTSASASSTVDLRNGATAPMDKNSQPTTTNNGHSLFELCSLNSLAGTCASGNMTPSGNDGEMSEGGSSSCCFSSASYGRYTMMPMKASGRRELEQAASSSGTCSVVPGHHGTTNSLASDHVQEITVHSRP